METQFDLAKRVVIVLVEPQHSGNIGAAARAMKNMGLSQLTIVAPQSFDPLRASWMSPGCEDIFRSMRIVNELSEALQGVQRVVASTARHRKNRQRVLSPRTLAKEVFEGPDHHTTAILFGREDFGLSKDAVLAAESILQIPTAPHASLNLSQAVMVVCHELFQTAHEIGNAPSGRLIIGRKGAIPTSELQTKTLRDEPADWAAMESAVGALVHLLDRVGYTRNTSADRVALSARKLMQSTTPTRRQIDIFRGMLRSVEWSLANHKEHEDD